MTMFAAAALALAVERFTGYPEVLQSRVRHPVQWMGSCLSLLEQRLHNDTLPPSQLRQRGIITLCLMLLIVGATALALSSLAHAVPYGWIIEALLATPLLAQHSLRRHVAGVAQGLNLSLEDGRLAVSHIVGRNPNLLDEAGVSRAALESLAENTADGIVAPLFWFIVGGLPGIAIYKAINTADSMIGHKSERYLHFGWAAARLDDLVNLPASRLSGALFILAAVITPDMDSRNALRAMWRDAGKHQSPNAGWPESALAGALNVSLGGPRHYDDDMVALPVMGDGISDLTSEDIARGIRLFDAALRLLFVFCLLAALLF